MHINSVFWVPAALLLIEGASGSRVERKSEELLPGPMVIDAFFLLVFPWEGHCFLPSLIEFPLPWYKVETGHSHCGKATAIMAVTRPDH